MTKKKKSQSPATQTPDTIATPANQPSTTQTSSTKTASDAAPTSSLTISRNKHWRYISAFHGPWLQLPHEILETLAHSNYLSPRPRQTDPSVLYDLLKIRKLVDEASNLAVRAQNGTASSALNSSRDDGLPGGSLGLSYRGGGNAKLSPERKFRMRELATQKLAQAYRIDEIAASVATMQSASTLDNVASFVLQRNGAAIDGKYVHFFHEKIPSRMMAECTPLTALDDIIRAEPGHAAPYRTRASTKIFKEDYMGAIQDLTEALALCKLHNAKHKAGRNQLVTMQTIREEAEKRKTWTKDWMQENKVAEEDQPSSLELQLLIQRGNQYLTVACQNVRIALDRLKEAQQQRDLKPVEKSPHPQSHTSEAYRIGLEAREIVRKNAKRALRDYNAFFANIDYAHVKAYQGSEDCFNHSYSTGGANNDRISRIVEEIDDECASSGNSNALIKASSTPSPPASPYHNGFVTPPRASVHTLADLLSATPPPGLPEFPSSSSTNDRELATYHPLLPETLHSFLLTHCLLQTPPKTLARIAHNVARIVRLADGYPFFLSARSPARADWGEILRKTEGTWNLNLGASDPANSSTSIARSWEQLCKPSQAAGWEKDKESKAKQQADGAVAKRSTSTTRDTPSGALAAVADSAPRPPPHSNAKPETVAQRKDRIHKECVIEALGDERVVDDDTFQRAVQARERRAWSDIEVEERGLANGVAAASPDAGAKGKANGAAAAAASPHVPRERRAGAAKDEAYLIGTERAELIARWILEAPATVEGMGSGKKKKGKGGAGKKAVEQMEALEDQTREAKLE